MNKNFNADFQKQEKIQRGKRIKSIREDELKMSKTQLGKEIGVSSQFLGLVEEGKGNLVYESIRRLRNISGHSADYILYGLDDSIINTTKKLLSDYSEQQIIHALDIIKDLTLFTKNA